MLKKLILCSSITYAIKGRNILSRKGYKAFITRPPVKDPRFGCGYCLSVDAKDFEDIMNTLTSTGVKVKHVFDLDDESGGAEDGLS